jgi:hypothetical protein
MLCLLLIREEKKKGKQLGGASFPGQTCPAGCAALGFSRPLGAIKNYFKDQSLNFMCT